MRFIKIFFFSIAFYFFAPVNSYAIIHQTYEKPRSETGKMPQKERNLLFVAVISFIVGIYPLVKGILLWQAAENLVLVGFGVIIGFLGAVFILGSLITLAQYFFVRYKRKRNGY